MPRKKKMMMAILDKKGRKMKKKFAYIMVKSKKGETEIEKNSTAAFYSVSTSSIL